MNLFSRLFVQSSAIKDKKQTDTPTPDRGSVEPISTANWDNTSKLQEKYGPAKLKWDSNQYDWDTFIYLCYCDIGTYKRWIRNAINPQKFFSNYAQLLNQLDELAKYESCYHFQNPTPHQELKQYKEKFPDLVTTFLYRCWESCLNKAASQKTIAKREEIVQQFFVTMETYYEDIPSQSKNTLVQIKKEPLDFQRIKPKEKPLPAFDNVQEKDLLNTLEQCTCAMDSYFALLRLIDFYYKYREVNSNYIQACKELCEKSIALLPYVDKEEQAYRGQPFTAHIPAFDRLYMINYHEKNYAAALKICKQQLGCKQVCKYPEFIQKINKRIETCQKKIDSQK